MMIDTERRALRSRRPASMLKVKKKTLPRGCHFIDLAMKGASVVGVGSFSLCSPATRPLARPSRHEQSPNARAADGSTKSILLSFRGKETLRPRVPENALEE